MVGWPCGQSEIRSRRKAEAVAKKMLEDTIKVRDEHILEVLRIWRFKKNKALRHTCKHSTCNHDCVPSLCTKRRCGRT